jgi:hyperosmotically inducible protein
MMRVLSVIAIVILALNFTDCWNQDVDDAGITAKVTSKLAVDPETSALKIDVDTTNGIVTLSGAVPTEAEKSKAEQIALNTEGVKSVVSNITVNPDSAGETIIGKQVDKLGQKVEEKTEEVASRADSAATDAKILAKIKAQYTIEGIFGTNVDVSNGEVLLKGEVGSAQDRSKAEEIARRTDGVRTVKNLLTIRKNS